MNESKKRGFPVTRLLVTAIPYVTVLVGLYVFNNAWIAFLPYHVAIVLVLASCGELDQFKRLKRGFSLKAVAVSIFPCLVAGVMIYLLFPAASLDGIDLGAKITEMGLGGDSSANCPIPVYRYMVLY